MAQLEIGRRLRNLRREKRISLTVLAEKSGVSVGLISQIERDLVTPSVISLFNLAKALGTDISYFFDEESAPYVLQRKGTHQVIHMDEDRYQHKMLSAAAPERALDMLLLTMRGGEEYSRATFPHSGEECVYVLSGELTFLIDNEVLTLNSGDSLYFHSTHPHRYINCGQEDCVSIWAITPKFF